jgi:transcriptional regulator with XRE-family HTH domain
MTQPIFPALVARMKSLMLNSNMSEAELARKTHLPQATINRILLGTTQDPRISTIRAIADIFGVTIKQLIGDEPLLQFPEKNHKQSFIPVIEWHEILDFTSPCRRSKNYTHTEWVLIDRLRVDGCFALRTTPSMEPKFRRGSTIIIEPNEPLRDYQIVVVSFNHQEPTIRRIEKDGGDIYFLRLKAARHEPAKPMQASDKIIGVITEARVC